MNIDLSTCNPKLRERIQRQIQREDAAKGITQPMAGLVRPEPQHREVQTLASRPPKQKGNAKGMVRCVVQIVRYGKRRLDDDNNIAAHKSTRDEVARELGIDDGDSRIKFDYDQVTTKGATGTHVIVSEV